MLQYLIIILDDTSTSFCHYANDKDCKNIMPVETLKKGIRFGMLENLQIQFVYPNYDLPLSYCQIIESIDHSKIKPLGCDTSDADVVVCNSFDELEEYGCPSDKILALRVCRDELYGNADLIRAILNKVARLDLVITDVESFSDEDIPKYKSVLESWSEVIKKSVVGGQMKQVNVLTDRLMLGEMNNCRAGDNSVTLAPDGNFYVCPAFYQAKEKENHGLGKVRFDIGNIDDGVRIKNPQLYKLDYSPICRVCDAFQCKRCIWLNMRSTYEVNTPGRQQCVISHVERNASRILLKSLKEDNNFRSDITIDKIDYLDPFEMIINKKS